MTAVMPSDTRKICEPTSQWHCYAGGKKGQDKENPLSSQINLDVNQNSIDYLYLDVNGFFQPIDFVLLPIFGFVLDYRIKRDFIMGHQETFEVCSTNLELIRKG